MKSITFWDITSCSPLSVNRRFGGTHRLHIQGRSNKFSKKPTCWFLSALISSTLKMETICSSETSVDTQRTTRRYVPEDDTLGLAPLALARPVFDSRRGRTYVYATTSGSALGRSKPSVVCCFLGCDALLSLAFWRNVLPPSTVKGEPSVGKGGTYRI
jgi:hypothetical protein